MAGQTRAKKYGSGGGGGNMLTNILGAYFGMPEISGGGMLGGEEMAAMGGPEAVIAEPEPVYQKPQIKKPGFMDNLLSKGQAGLNYANLDAQMKMGEYDNVLRQALIKEQIKGQAGNINLRDQLEKVAREDAYKKAIEEADIKDALTRGLGKNTQLRDQFVIPNTTTKLQGDTFKGQLENAAYQTPDMQTAHVQNMFAGLAKQGLENNKTQTEIDTAKKKLPTMGFMDVGADAKIDPATGKAYMFQKPLMEAPAPGYEGGLKEINLSGFKKVPGGVLSELGGGSSFKGVPEMLARPALNPALPQFAFPEKPKMELPPGYEPYREAIERSNPGIQAEEQVPIVPQPATPITPGTLIPGVSQQDKILQFLRRPRPGVGMMNPYTIR